MSNLIRQIIGWNEMRYTQIHNNSLTFNLLDEELTEFVSASGNADKVEQIDALVDIIYVSIGALWKLGLNTDQVYKAISIVCNSNDTKSVKHTNPSIKANIDKGSEYVSPTEELTKLVKELI